MVPLHVTTLETRTACQLTGHLVGGVHRLPPGDETACRRPCLPDGLATPVKGFAGKRDEIMHFNLRKAAVVSVLPLLGGALAVGATALPASAQTFQDTALQAFNLTQPTTTTGAVVNGVASGTGKGSTLTFTAPNGEAFGPVVFTQGSTDATLAVSPLSIVIVLTS